MLKKIFILLNILILIFISGCSKKSTDLIINETTIKPTPINIAQEQIEQVNKPLLQISQNDTIKILVREDGAPGMYLGNDGLVHGFYVDLAKVTMKEMGQKYIFESFNNIGPAAHGLKAGTYHLALAVPDIIDYQSFLNLSIPYEILHFVIFIHNDNISVSGTTEVELLESLHGKKVGVQSQGQIHQALRNIKEIEFIEYATTTKALEDLDKGLIDAVPDVKRIGIYYTEKNNWNIKTVGTPIISQKLTTGFSPAIDISLMKRYNVALQKIIDDGRFDTLYESYFGPMDEEDKP